MQQLTARVQQLTGLGTSGGGSGGGACAASTGDDKKWHDRNIAMCGYYSVLSGRLRILMEGIANGRIRNLIRTDLAALPGDEQALGLSPRRPDRLAI